MPVTMLTTSDAARQMRQALESNDPALIEQGWRTLCEGIANQAAQTIQQDMAAYQRTQDDSILQSRGYRVLTSAETRWYQRVIDAMRAPSPKQAFAEIIGSDAEEGIMPTTILTDVFRRLESEHPLLSLITTQQVGYLTRWIRNKHNVQKAAWGAITAAVTQEITSAFEEVDIKQNKLSCYAVISLGMLDLGPVWLDQYIRTCLYEAYSCALEAAVICGTGKDQPVGMDRDLGSTSYNTESGWKQKTPVPCTSFAPASYGPLVARLAKDENGKPRLFDRVCLVVSLTDYLNKVMPATTVLTAQGTYTSNVFPFPTDAVVSNFVEEGKAILGLPKEYLLCLGNASRNGAIVYDDSVKFLEDQRVFKLVQYADGRAEDNTSFLLLDISGLEAAYLLVKDVGAATASA